VFYIEKQSLACPTTDARICTYRDVFLVRELDTDVVAEATWDPIDADATCALLNGIDEQARVLAAA